MYSMVNTDIIDKLLEQISPKTIVEIGTYYGGWACYLDNVTDAQIFTFQSPNDAKLNHIPESTRGEYHNDFEWKKLIFEKFPKEYHGFFDFNLLAENISNTENVTLILQTSPLKYDWKYNFDLCTIDITPEFSVNKIQFDYWHKYCNKTGIINIGAYGHQQEMFEYVKTFDNFSVKKIDEHYVWAIKK